MDCKKVFETGETRRMDIIKVIIAIVVFVLVLRTCSEEVSYRDDMDSEIGESSTLTFHGYDCLQDCSGHEAGYEWAEDNDISDVDDCSGNSNSFIEGCRAYVKENY